jgi:hypothetical protein
MNRAVILAGLNVNFLRRNAMAFGLSAVRKLGQKDLLSSQRPKNLVTNSSPKLGRVANKLVWYRFLNEGVHLFRSFNFA